MIEEKIAFKLQEELMKIPLIANSKQDIFKQMGGLLIEKGYAKPEYIDALNEREEEYPTGILVGDIGVAIPHTDAKYVNKTAISVGVLDKSIPFELMGCDEGTVDVDIVFMLSVSDSQNHLLLLQKIMGIFQKQEILMSIKNSKSGAEVLKILEKQLNIEEM